MHFLKYPQFFLKYPLKYPQLFNHIYQTGSYPTEWGVGIIAPIHKRDDKDDPKNYRGVTLINVIAKIYSQILLNRLTNWSIKHDKSIQNQFGFQKGKSTIDCVFMLYSIILKSFS